MVKLTHIIFSFILVMPISLAAQESSSHVRKSKTKYATLEPGTFLAPKAYRLLKTLDRVEAKSLERPFPKTVMKITEANMHKVLDTIVTYPEHNVPIRVYYPSRACLDKPSPIIFFIHGGGFILGSIKQYDMAVKKLARTINCIVVSVDYRLAPEHPFPAALNDISAVLTWINDHSLELGGDEKGICVIGDSAGANLATVLSLKCRDKQVDYISCQVLYYPTTTFAETEFPSRKYFFRDSTKTYLLTEGFVTRAKAEYIGTFQDEMHPYLSPLEANLSSGLLPPALIITAQCDPLRDEARLYAELLSENGHHVKYMEYPGLIHGFFNFYMIFKESKDSMLLVKNFLNEHSIKP